MRPKYGITGRAAMVLLLLVASCQPADGWMTVRPFLRPQTTTSTTYSTSSSTQLFVFRAQEKGKLKVPEFKGERPTIDVNDLLKKKAPGEIISTEEELKITDEVLESIENGTRKLPDWFYDTYSFEDLEAKDYEKTDNPDAVRSGDLGKWTVRDIDIQFDNEWEKGKPGPEGDPNLVAFKEWEPYLPETLKDEDGIELGWTPLGGHGHPVDERTIVGWTESYNIRNITRDPDGDNFTEFHKGDLEIALNDEIKEFRKTIPRIETHEDPFFKEYEVPTYTARWHGYEEELSYPVKNWTNNRFTKPEDLTDFDSMTPYEARKTATRYARMKNAEWMPNGMSQEVHRRNREPFEKVGSIVGTLREGEKDPKLVKAIEPAMKIFGNCVTLLSIHRGNIYRFKYWGMIKNKWGMRCWMETLIRNCGVDCANVIFETGFRKRDPDLDSGDHWYGDYGNAFTGEDWDDGTYEEESEEEEYDRIEWSYPDDDPQYINYYKVSDPLVDDDGIESMRPKDYAGTEPQGWVQFLNMDGSDSLM